MRRRSLTSLLIFAAGAASAALACAATLAPAQAEAQRVAPSGYFGASGSHLRAYVDPEHREILEGLAGSMGAQGVQWARVSFDQSIDNRLPGLFNWYATDTIVRALAESGVRAEASFVGTAAWTADPLEWLDCGSRSAPANLDGWGRWVGAAAARYGPSGTFWSANPGIPKLPIQRWEIGNEPNSGIFWCPGSEPHEYAGAYAASRAAIRSADAGAEVMVGGLAPRFGWQTPTDHDVPTFLSRMMAANPGPVDSVAIHPYGESAEKVLSRVADFREAMQAAGLGSTPMVVNEVGWYTSGPDGPLKATESERATRLAAVANQIWRTDCNVTGFGPHSWVTAQEDPDYDEHWFGLTDATTGAPLPSGLAYGEQIRLARGQGGQTPPQGTVGTCSRRTVTVQKGPGTVTSTPDPIVCGETCTGRFQLGSQVRLRAVPYAGYLLRDGPAATRSAATPARSRSAPTGRSRPGSCSSGT